MSKVIAVVFSDLHINNWSKFNKDGKRTVNHFTVLNFIIKACIKYKCPALFCGDLLHKPENLPIELYDTLVKSFNRFNRIYKKTPFDIYCISGNHDMVQVVKPSEDKFEKPVSWVSLLSNQYKFIHCIDFDSVKFGNFTVFGVPYIDHNIGLNDYLKNLDLDLNGSILLLHTDYPGAKDTDDTEVGTSENLNTNLLGPFELTLIGHIHKPQRLGKKVYMVGAPLQQRRTDRNCKLGYWLVMEDFSMKFVDLSDNFPRFIDVTSEDEIKDDGNYYTVVAKVREVQKEQVNTLKKGLSKKRLVKRYLKSQYGIADPKKESILLDIIKESEND